MKRLTDYEGEEAVDLWADLLDPISTIINDKDVAKVIRSGASKIVIAQEILKKHKKEAEQILLRIDPEPINGLNLVVRLIEILADIGNNEEIKPFFGYAAQEKMEQESSGSAMVNTEAEEK